MKPLDLWLPPAGAGTAVGCLATSFTFDADMFSRDCLARFLGLTTAYGEGDRASDLSLMIEEEERLGEATVTVLVDRSYRAEPRNLRWDIVPVVVQGGLLHAKSAVLLWERTMRLIIGSANLTPAGYRRQVEMVAGFDFTSEESDLPIEIARQLLSEIRLIATDLVPEVAAGPRTRMLKTLDLADQRLLDAPAGSSRDFKWAVAPVRTGKKALEGFDEVWRGSQPRECVALSPFWDGEPGNAEVNGVAAIASLLSRRKTDGSPSRIELAVAVDVAEGGRIVRAPPSLTASVPTSIESRTVIFDPGDAERRLHAKWISYRNDGWIAAMFGSSNLTAKGLGLDRRSHRELNLWLATSTTSKPGKQLASMIRDDGSIELSDELCDVGEDEDESALIPLPMGFVDVSIEGSLERATLRFHFDSDQLPGTWTILHAEGAGNTLLTSNTWNKASTVTVPLSSSVLPATVLVRWHDPAGVHHEAPWVVNVDDLRILPPPAELHDLTVDALLTVLASSRPLRQILEAEFRRAEQHPGPDNGQAIDPLKRYANSSFLLPRVRRQSAALWGLRQRLERPMSTPETLHWRIFGSMGPLYLAERLLEEAARPDLWLPGEAAFLMIELALTVSRVDWRCAPPLTLEEVNTAAHDCLLRVKALLDSLPVEDRHAELEEYLDLGFKEVMSR